jgi:hypothetical protein
MPAWVRIKPDDYPFIIEYLLVNNPVAELRRETDIGGAGETRSLFQALSVTVDQHLIPLFI